LDHLWREHIVTLEHLRQVIGLRGYAQRDPLHEYKSEGFTLFEQMLARLREHVTGQLMHVVLSPQGEDDFLEYDDLPEMEAHHIDPFTGEDDFDEPPPPSSRQARRAARKGNGAGRGGGPGGTGRGGKGPPVAARQGAAGVDPSDPSTWGKVSRNAACPCGSGKKYKHCHGALTAQRV